MHLISIFKDINNDFFKYEYKESKVLSRKFSFKNKCSILVSVKRKDALGEVSYLLPESYAISELNNIPKLKGMELRVSNIIENGVSSQYLTFSQIEDYEPYIFYVVMQDIVDRIDNCKLLDKLIEVITKVLNKWSKFFQNKDEIIMSSNSQQGLYGELYILEKLINLKGEMAVKYWTGCDFESHDFYINNNAIEVKSSSLKGPDTASISNEYQLDDSGISGILYLIYLKLKKSSTYGESLPEIIERIIKKIDESIINDFIEKLFKIGYIYEYPELYKLYFSILDETCYEVKDDFPRLTKKNLNKGIGSVTYSISLDACSSFQILIEEFYGGIVQ